MGNGKTASMVFLTMLDFLNGRNIRANFTLSGIEYEYIPSLKAMLKRMQEGATELGDINSTYAIDELSTWFSCYERPSKNNEGLLMFDLIKQTRKMGIKLYYTSQTYSRIPKFLRDLTHKIYIVSKCHYTDGQYKKCESDNCRDLHYIALRECIQQGNDLIQPKPTKFFKLPLEIFRMYDTTEIIYRKLENPEEELKRQREKRKTAKDYVF